MLLRDVVERIVSEIFGVTIIIFISKPWNKNLYILKISVPIKSLICLFLVNG